MSAAALKNRRRRASRHSPARNERNTGSFVAVVGRSVTSHRAAGQARARSHLDGVGCLWRRRNGYGAQQSRGLRSVAHPLLPPGDGGRNYAGRTSPRADAQQHTATAQSILRCLSALREVAPRENRWPGSASWGSVPHMNSDGPSGIDLLKPAEVATRLRVSRTWLYDAAKNGRIPSIRIGGRRDHCGSSPRT